MLSNGLSLDLSLFNVIPLQGRYVVNTKAHLIYFMDKNKRVIMIRNINTGGTLRPFFLECDGYMLTLKTVTQTEFLLVGDYEKFNTQLMEV